MNSIRLETPQFIEGITVRVQPELVEQYMEAEEEIWLEGLSQIPGFAGGEVWVSQDHPGEVTSLYFWESEAAFAAIDPLWRAAKKEETMAVMDAAFVRAWHGEERRFRVKEFR